MHTSKNLYTVISLGVSLLAQPAMASDAAVFTPHALPWKATLNVPGREQADLLGDAKQAGPYVMRVKLPPHYKQLAHSHPDDRSYTILAGTWYIGWGEKFDEAALIALPAGSFYIEHGNRPHFVATKDDGAVIQISGHGPSGQKFVEQSVPGGK